MSSRGLLVVLCGPSGCGKSTLIGRAKAQIPGLVFSVSSTTRPPRAQEQDGVDYYFVSEAEFEAEVARGEFLEHARVHGNLYGTHRRLVEEQVAAGKTVILDIDVQGARQVRAKGVEGLFLFLMPPSLRELERRLRVRATDAEEIIQERLAVAAGEMAEASTFDATLVNDDLDLAEAQLVSLLQEGRDRHQPLPPPTAP